MSDIYKPDWASLLLDVVNIPGKLSACYKAFHSYSIGNAIVAMCQLEKAGIPLGPLATYKGWLAKGRQVQKGQKAIFMCQPIMVKDKTTQTEKRVFIWKRGWFAVAQTAPIEGMDQQNDAPVERVFDMAKAMATLDIAEIPWGTIEGNSQGYAMGRSIAVNPVAILPHKTRFHEMAHVVLGHTSEALGLAADDEKTPQTMREVEAETVAYICIETLGLPGAVESRGYVQHWIARHGADAIPEKAAHRILMAAQKILSAGAVKTATESDAE